MSNFVNLLDIIYPVNSIYITASGVSLQHLLAVRGLKLKMAHVLRHMMILQAILVARLLALNRCQFTHTLNMLQQITVILILFVKIIVKIQAVLAHKIILKGVVLVMLAVGKIIILIHMLAKFGCELLKI